MGDCGVEGKQQSVGSTGPLGGEQRAWLEQHGGSLELELCFSRERNAVDHGNLSRWEVSVTGGPVGVCLS